MNFTLVARRCAADGKVVYRSREAAIWPGLVRFTSSRLRISASSG